jgi:PKD repeat protein
MKAIRTMLAVIILFGSAGLTYSKTVPGDLARQVALNAWTEKTPHASNTDNGSFISDFRVVQNNTGVPVYYIFNIAPGKGFIIIAADDRIEPILGWSEKGPYTDTNHPPAFDWFMSSIRKQAETALLQDDRAEQAVSRDWERYSSPGFVPVKSLDAGPLLQTTWDQDCFYNEQCPADAGASGSCFHAYAGCGATSMAQILKYWSYPQHGTGSHGYLHPVYGNIFVNFAASTYNYSAMPDALSAGNNDVAQLIYHCGVAEEMDYGPSSSSCDVQAIDAAFRNYFDYNPALSWKLRADYTASTWQSMVKGEIDAGRPLLYYGNDNGAVGHAFVCDGYQGTTYFHFNWGWSGTYDGYFYLDDLTPGGSVYTDNQRAIFNLRPNQAAGITTMDFESATDFSLTFSPWTVADVDAKPTFGITDHTFPHQGEAMAYIAFNPAGVTPSMASDPEIQPHGGSRFGACFAATTPSNNDWFISPQVQLDYYGSFSIWVKSYTAAYGLEKYKVAVSTTDNNPASFSVISGATPLQAPTDWTKMTFDLSAYNGQMVYVGIQCVSDTSFIFMIDDLAIDPGITGSLLADFTADPTTVNPGQTVNFTDASVGTPTSWTWTFQGGSPYNSTVQNPSNIRYDNPGIYDVTLTVSDGTDTNTRTKTSYIYVTQALPSQMSLDFESLLDWTTTFAPWTTADVNGGETYNIQGVTFPGSGYPMAWICFNPTATSPPLTASPAHSGVRLGASFASPPPWAPSNKWLITPKMYLGTGGKIELWVRSYTVQYGNEEYNIGVSETGNAPADFTSLNGIHPEQAPVSWTLRSYSLSDYAGKEVYIGIQCVSNDRFIFMIDDISITSTVGVDEKAAASVRVYPNPASGELFVKFMEDAPGSYTGELFNAIGSRVRAFRSGNPGNTPVKVDVKGLSEGIYFLKLTYGSTSLIKKVIIIE